MRLRRFRIQNFRCIEDSGEVTAGHITVLVGKNESGKTAVLRALQKLNPKTSQPFDKLREFPRKRYHEFDENQTYPVTTMEFELDEKDRQALKIVAPELEEASAVLVEQDFSGERTFRFEPSDPKPLTLQMCASERAEIDKALAELSNSSGTADLAAIKDEVLQAVERFFESVPGDSEIRSGPFKRKTTTLITKLKALETNPPRQQAVNPLVKGLESLLSRADQPSPRAEAEKAIMRRMPRFVYFDVYQLLENKVQLAAFVQRKRQGAMTKEDVTADTLFTLAGLDVDRLVELEKSDGKSADQVQRNKDERALLVSRASLGLSGRLIEIWKQKRNRVEFYLDGDYLRLWVVDERDGSKLEYEEQSKGFHWFFSFYVIFNVEAEREHREAILLLDEPGLHLHPAAQEDMIKVLRQLSESNQIIYSTHSPFMIDMDHLETVRLVTLDERTGKGTRVLDIGKVADPDTLFPLQAAIGYSLSQSLFVGKRNLIVEGVTDYWLLASMAALFRDAGMSTLDPGIVIIPAGGARKVTYLSSLMTGQKLSVGVLLDSDPEGRSAREELVKTKLLRDKHVVLLEDVLGSARECELEDLLPEDVYVKAVNEVYRKELSGKTLATPLPQKMPRVTQRVEAELKNHGISFHKSRPARYLLDYLAGTKVDQLPMAMVDNFRRLFELINKTVPAP